MKNKKIEKTKSDLLRLELNYPTLHKDRIKKLKLILTKKAKKDENNINNKA